MEFLDDRVILFATAAGETKTFCYSLRATTAGHFSLPPVQAACMYDESIASLGETGTVTVSR